MGRADFTLSAGPNNVSAEVRGALGSPKLDHGVDSAADLLLAEGIEASIARHARVATTSRARVRAMGLRLWPAREEIAACVTSIAVQDGLTHIRWRDHVRERYGVHFSGARHPLSRPRRPRRSVGCRSRARGGPCGALRGRLRGCLWLG